MRTTAVPPPAVPGDRTAIRFGRASRFVMAGLALLLGLAGTGLYGYSPATDLYQRHLQTRLAGELRSPESHQAYRQRRVGEGRSLTRLQIPTIGVDVVVVEGTSASALRAGAGHYPETPLPGEDGNVAIAGHRTTFGRPFTNLDRLKPGDDILLDTPVGGYRYRVSRAPFVVHKADWSPIAATSGKVLTLSTCHPKGSARQRLIVRAELVPEGQR